MEKDDGGRQKLQPLLAKVGHFNSHFRDITLPPNECCDCSPLKKAKSNGFFGRSSPTLRVAGYLADPCSLSKLITLGGYL